MSERCAAPHCGRSMSEGSGREPYDFCDLQFCDRDCARRWAHDEVLDDAAGAANSIAGLFAGIAEKHSVPGVVVIVGPLDKVRA